MEKNQYITDTPIELNHEKDLLKTGVYANALKEAILSSPKEQSFIIGLFGSWGAGKSSIVHTAERQITSENENVKFITYDAWKYANDSFRRMFLLTMQESLKLETSDEMRRFYQAESHTMDPPTVKAGKKYAMYAFMALWLIFSIIAIVNYCKNGDVSAGLLAVILIQGLIAFSESTFKFFAGMEKLFEKMQINVQKEKMFAPEQFEDCFSEMVNKSLKSTQNRNALVESVRTVLEYIKPVKKRYEKLVIIFDNIDRCHSSMAYELLTDIKTFLSSKNLDVVYVIPVDDVALQKHLFSNGVDDHDSCEKDKEEFLRKLFNVALRIKPHQTTEIYRYAVALCKNNNLNFKGDTLAIISKNFATNPRRIVQLINNLITELNLYDDAMSAKYETQICSLLIIKEEFSFFYYQLLESPNSILPDNRKEFIDNKKLNDFLRTVEKYFFDIKPGIINQILTNSNAIFSDIPDHIKQAVNTYDTETVIDYLGNDEDSHSKIFNLILHCIESERTFASREQKANWLDFISVIHENFEFNLSYYTKIEVFLLQTIAQSIHLIQETDAVCALARDMRNTRIYVLWEELLNYLTESENKINENFSSLYTSMIGVFSDDVTLKTLAPIQEELTLSGVVVDKEFDFTENHYQYLFSEKLIAELITEITQLSSSEFFNKELWWIILHKKSISDNLMKSYIARILDLSPFVSYKLAMIPAQGNFDDYGLRQINEHLSCLPDFTAACQPLINAVQRSNFVSRNYPRPSTGQLYFEKRFEIIGKVPIDDCVEFFYHVYRLNLSENADFIKTIATKLFALSSDLLEPYLVKLIQKEFTLSSLYDIIISNSSFNTEQSFAILDRITSATNQENLHFITAQQAVNLTSKLKDRLNESRIEQAVLSLLNIETLQATVISTLAKGNTELIATAPDSIQEHCVSVYSAKNHSTFRETFNYLKLVAQNGTDEQKEDLMGAIFKDINQDKESELVASQLDVLLSLETRRSEYRTRVARFCEHLECEIAGDENKRNLLIQIINKFST